MSDSRLYGNSRDDRMKLAQWLQNILQIPPRTRISPAPEDETQLELLLDSNYHLPFYQQLPDFVMALLANDAQATVRYAPLLYHLAGCTECHSAYLDLYDSMRAALYPRGARPMLGQGTRTLSATPQRMLAHLCRTLISQAEATLLQARREHTNADEAARALLQLALQVGARISQGSLRHRALQDLVRVATFSEEGPAAPQQEAQQGHYSYTLPLVGAGSRGRRTVRRGELLRRQADEAAVIHIQSRSLEGTITQREQTLELHLQGLDASLRGHYVIISIPLGSLLEPVRWLGGNPRAIRSTAPVDEHGSLTTPLGQTELRLRDPEEYNLLEAMFMLLEVRRADQDG